MENKNGIFGINIIISLIQFHIFKLQNHGQKFGECLEKNTFKL